MINKNDCAFSTIWENKINDYSWRETLITKINLISHKIHNGTLRYGANKIILNPSKKEMIQNLTYYNVETEKLYNYIVVFNDECENEIIYVYNDMFEKPDYLYLTHKYINDNRVEIEITFDPVEMSQIKKLHCGYITIKPTINYGN